MQDVYDVLAYLQRKGLPVKARQGDNVNVPLLLP